MMRQLTAHQHDRRLLTATTTLQRVAGLLSLLTTAAAVHTAIARLPTVGHPHRPACLSRFQSGLPVNRSAGVAQVAQQLRHVSPGFRDAVPTPFEAPNGQRAVFCLIQKVGSTRCMLAVNLHGRRQRSNTLRCMLFLTPRFRVSSLSEAHTRGFCLLT